MVSKFVATFAAVVAVSVIAIPTMVSAGSSADTGAVSRGDSLRIEVRMSLGNDQMQAKGVYRERQKDGGLQQRFQVDVDDAAPGSSLAVTVRGNVVGTIFINALGSGILEFRTNVDDPGDGQEIPAGFPRLVAGDTLDVGPMSGTFN